MKTKAVKIFLETRWSSWLVLFLLLDFACPLSAAEMQRLTGHVPSVVAHLAPAGRLAGTNYLRLAIGLPLRNQVELTNLLAQIYNRGSTNYHRYLTPAQFAERFGPTAGDYQSLMAFAQANGLKITRTHANRLLLDVAAPVTQIERVFHTNLRLYPHPREGRNFYAPDAEPALDLAVPILHVSGLDNYILPRPMNLRKTAGSKHLSSQPLAGPGSGPAYMGGDFRKAYVPGTVMTGQGQQVGLFQMQSGFYQSDITRYENQTGLPNVPIRPVLLDGYDGSAGAANDECSLDIEMAISMAPGLSQVLVYEGVSPDDVLNQMATDDLAQQLSSSWAFPVDPTTEEIFQQFAGQGQSFFNASGDNGAWVGGVLSPFDDPNITSVGGTTLTTTNGAWEAETVWDWDSTNSSGGGISTEYSIPYWQQGVDMSLNQGSTSMRNIPDVALTADNIGVFYDNGASNTFGGTSCAAPLWAGFTALINQQAADNYSYPIGFLNPSIYYLAQQPNYTNIFHDILTGNNINDESDDLFYATSGYDLCTGWGTPTGQNLIDALVGPANPTPAYIITQPTNQTVIVGAPVTFSVLAGGLPPFSYQWSCNGTNLVGATNDILTLENIQLDEAGNYQVVVTNEFGLADSAIAVLTVDQQPTCDPVPSGLVGWWPGEGSANDLTGVNNGVLEGGIDFATGEVGMGFLYNNDTADVRIPASPSLDVGTGSGFTVEAWINCSSVSQLNPMFEWNMGDGVTYEGAHFYVWSDGSLYANIIDTTGSVLPGHIIQTSSGLISAGTFYHVALTYDYASGIGTIYCNGNMVIQASLGQFTPLTSYDLYLGRRPPTENETWSFAGVLDEPSLYDRALTSDEVMAIYAAGSGGKCQPASPPEITIPPASQTVRAGGNVVLSVVATGTPVLTYQWIFNDANIIAGATNSTLILTNVQPNAAGLYSVIITNAQGSITSADAVLTVEFGPDCVAAPSGQVSWWPAQGNALDIIGGNNGFLEGGISFTNGIVGQAFWYTNAGADVRIPASGSLNVGAGGSFTVEAWINCSTINQLNPIFEWNKGDGVTYEGVHFYAGTGGSLFGNVVDTGGSVFLHSFSSSSGVITTNVFYHVAMTYDNGSGIATIYCNGTVVAQQTLGQLTPLTSYDLYLGRRPLTQGETYTFAGILDEPSVYNRALTVSEILSIYQAGAGGKCQSETPPNIVFQPASSAVGLGSNAFFSVAATGFPYLSYQWKYQGINLIGATNSMLTVANVQFSQAGAYSVLVTNPLGSALSSDALLTVLGEPPIILVQPTNETVVLGSNPTFTVTASSASPMAYRWHFNGTNNISGATNASLTLTNAQAAQAGAYSVVVTNIWGRAPSANALLSFFVPPTITSQPTNLNVKAGTTAIFSVTAAGSAPLAYQWFWNTNMPIAKATNATLTLANVQLANAGTYEVLITNVAGAVLSTNALLVVHLQDHFAWGTIPSPRFVKAPFTATIQAQSVSNSIVTNFTGTVSLTSTLGIPVQPSVSGPFVRGSWTGTVMIAQTVTNLVLEANDGLGDIGLANAISILNRPALMGEQYGDIFLVFWPTNIGGFIVESAPRLDTSNWVQIANPPLLFGNQNLEVFPMTSTNTYYRLLYTNP